MYQVCLLLYFLSIGFKGQTMIYSKHFKLKIEQHEPNKNVGEPMFSRKVIFSCSIEASVVLHSFFLLMSVSYYRILNCTDNGVFVKWAVWSCIYVIGVSSVPLTIIFLSDFELYRRWGIFLIIWSHQLIMCNKRLS